MKSAESFEREVEAARQIASNNNLTRYAPFGCAISVYIYFTWNMYWYRILSQNPRQTKDLDFNLCHIHIYTAIISSLLLIVNAVYFYCMVCDDSDGRYVFPPQLSAAWCGAVCIAINFCAHLAMALNWVPIFLSPWRRAAHIPLLGEWISIVPLLTTLMHGYDVRDKRDLKRLIVLEVFLLCSAAAGAWASLVENKSTATTMVMFSVISFVPIFTRLYENYTRYATVKEYIKKRSEKPLLLGFPTDTTRGPSDYQGSKKFELRADGVMHMVTDSNTAADETPVAIDFVVKEVVTAVRNQNVVASFEITLYYILCWGFLSLIHVASMTGNINHYWECALVAVGDIIAKIVYSFVICRGFAQSKSYIHNLVKSLEKHAPTNFKRSPFYPTDENKVGGTSSFNVDSPGFVDWSVKSGKPSTRLET